ncbi:MAG: stage II sporulation protein M [Deltaproteobacteria bacterium]|jgi:uncharacterized membrane protein SpoIIM required for sporulation|nr:stage II sporulation protein M [Deltaproteobacteria bacterium]
MMETPKTNSELKLKSAVFRQKREASWLRLDALITQLEKRSFKSLTASEALELPLLYQTAISSLALARRLFIDISLIDYLENLALRGHFAVYGPRKSFMEVLTDFFARDFPRAVRALKLPVLLAFLALFSGVAAGFLEVASDESAFYSLVPAELAGDRGPAAPVSRLRDEIIFAPWAGFEESFIHFASYLFERNSFVAFLAFGLGFALGVPTVFVLFNNGQILGAMTAVHWRKDIALDFIGWVSIHGVTELLAIILAGGAGLGVAIRILFPGRQSRLDSLAHSGPQVAAVMVGATFMLLVAGFIEGGLRQLVGFTFPRFFIAGLTLFAWAYYFLLFGKEDQ